MTTKESTRSPNPMRAYLPYACDTGTTTLESDSGFWAWLMTTREA